MIIFRLCSSCKKRKDKNKKIVSIEFVFIYLQRPVVLVEFLQPELRAALELVLVVQQMVVQQEFLEQAPLLLLELE